MPDNLHSPHLAQDMESTTHRDELPHKCDVLDLGHATQHLFQVYTNMAGMSSAPPELQLVDMCECIQSNYS